MDQTASLHGKAGHALLLDCRTRRGDAIPLPLRDHTLLIADTGVEEFIARAAPGVVRARSTDPEALAALLRSRDVTVAEDGDGALAVSGASTDHVGRLAGAAGITLLELTAQQASLEEAFVDMTRDAVEFRAPSPEGGQS